MDDESWNARMFWAMESEWERELRRIVAEGGTGAVELEGNECTIVLDFDQHMVTLFAPWGGSRDAELSFDDFFAAAEAGLNEIADYTPKPIAKAHGRGVARRRWNAFRHWLTGR